MAINDIQERENLFQIVPTTIVAPKPGPYLLYSTGFVSRMTAAKGDQQHQQADRQDTLAEADVHQHMVPVFVQKVEQGILPTSRKAMVMNSLNGSYTR